MFNQKLLNDLSYLDSLGEELNIDGIEDLSFPFMPNPLNFNDKFIDHLFDNKVEYIGKYISTTTPIKPISEPKVVTNINKETLVNENIIYQSTVTDTTKVISTEVENKEVEQILSKDINEEEIIYEDYKTYFIKELFNEKGFFNRFYAMSNPLFDIEAIYDKLGVFLITLYLMLGYGVYSLIAKIPFIAKVIELSKQNNFLNILNGVSFYIISVAITICIITILSFLYKPKEKKY